MSRRITIRIDDDLYELIQLRLAKDKDFRRDRLSKFVSNALYNHVLDENLSE